MNLKKYMSTGQVVEDMNHLHGRFAPSKSGMIPRFEQRKMGALRTKSGQHGGRHIVFGSKVDAQISNPSPMQKPHIEKQSSGAHRKIAVSTQQSFVEARSGQPRHGVFKRAIKGETSFRREGGHGYQPDLFEKSIPIEKGMDVEPSFEIPIQFVEPIAEVAHELPVRRPSTGRRFVTAISRWLRKG
jgi:hypothetical protein